MFENHRKEIWKSKILLHKSPSNRSFTHRIYCLLMQADNRGSADIIDSI